MAQEKVEVMRPLDESGHLYQLNNVNEGSQKIKFIQKKPEKDGTLSLVKDGTTNEALLEVLIHRIRLLNDILNSNFNTNCLAHLNHALSALRQRTQDRQERGVEGTIEG